MKITVILPTYKEALYLDLCIQSFYETQFYDNDLIVIVDGFYDLNKKVLNKYKDKNFKIIINEKNKGIAFSQNIGVEQAKTEKILIINDDNVFTKGWDKQLLEAWNFMQYNKKQNNFFFVPNQIEPNRSIFKSFLYYNFGLNVNEFNLNTFLEKEQKLRINKIDEYGWTLPIYMNKNDYMKVGGWDVNYNSPHYVDLDFFYKLQLCSMKSFRVHSCNFYHFGGKATKNSDNKETKEMKKHFTELENKALLEFKNKWKFVPVRNQINYIIKTN